MSCVQLIEQRLGLFQIERVEAFGELAVDRSEKIAGLIRLYPKCGVRDLSVTNSCRLGSVSLRHYRRLQLLARLVGCRQYAHFLRQFES
jgi:hypothetical protein